MKILYITRKYPPSVGGMEKMNYCLARELSKRAQVEKIVWGHSQFFMPLFLAATFIRLLWRRLLKRSYDAVILGDAFLAPLGAFIKKLMRTRVICITHGLDVTYDRGIYQKMFIPALSDLDMVVCVSAKTQEECRKRGVGESKLKVIPNGIDIKPAETDRESFIKEMGRLNINIFENTRILLTVGRLIKRKGVVWFVENVLKDVIKSKPEVIYVIVGEGAEKEKVLSKIAELGLGNNVFLTGRIQLDKPFLSSLYSFSDLFIMPNIPVKGDMEGFGIVALEAASCGLPVVASDLEGIKDAVSNGVSGILVPPEEGDRYSKEIVRLLSDDNLRESISRQAVEYVQRFTWDKIAEKYLDEIEGIVKE